MPNFAFRKNKFSTGQRLIVDLIIDKVNQFESFKDRLEKNQLKKLNVISSSILQISENRTLPQNKHRKLHSKFDIYEFKSGDLRLYYTKTKGGTIISLGGYKNNQTKDIKKMESICEKLITFFKTNKLNCDE